MADEIFKNDGRISNAHPWIFRVDDCEFIVRFIKFNMADPRWRIEFSKMIINSVKNVYLRVFEVADYKFFVIFTTFNIVDPKWRMKFSKLIQKI